MTPPLADRLRSLPPETRAKIFAAVARKLGEGSLADLRYDWEGFWLRASQIVSPEELERHSLVVYTGPRGDGKTKAASYLFDRTVRSGTVTRPRIFAANEADVDKAVVHGESGIFSLYASRDPDRPRWISGEGPAGVLRYRNGVEVVCFTAKAPEGAVSYNADLDFYDDVAKWGSGASVAWRHARVSCRIGIAAGIVATTRRGATLLRKLLKGDTKGVLIRRGEDLQANRYNLSLKIYRELLAELGDSDFWRQEMEDEDISASSPFVGLDFDSAPIRVLSAPRDQFAEIVVAVDPAEGKGGDHDDWGIGAAGRRHDGHVVALDDVTGQYDDAEAADKVLELCDTWGASQIIVESNRGPRVLHALRAAQYKRELEALKEGAPPPRPLPELVPVRAKEGKRLRAGPLRRLYLDGTLHHVAGLRGLEKQQREFEPDAPPRPRQDDHIDWLVHAVHHLADLGDGGGVGIEQVAGIGERVRQMQGADGARREGRDALIRSDTVPAGDPRSSYRPRGRGGLNQRRIL